MGSKDEQSMKSMLPYGRHVIDEDDIAAVVSVLKGDWLTTGPHVEAFEVSLRQTCNVAHAVSCSSATAGLHMAALALGLGPGTAVIVPSITFLASASAPHLTGAEIVFADVDAESGLLTPETFLQAVESHTGSPIKAVIPVHLTGRVCDMTAIKAIADQHGIAVIEDACHALGAKYADTEGHYYSIGACVHSDVSVFSFHPVKTIAAGEGGAVTTSNSDLAAKLVLARSHGMVRDPECWTYKDIGFDADGQANPWYYEMHAPALNYRMSDINAALGGSQLKKLEIFLARRAELADLYNQYFASFDPIILPPTKQQRVQLGWHLYAARIDFTALGVTRGKLMRRLKKLGIGTQVHYIPVPWQPYWRGRGLTQQVFPGATAYFERTLSLPLFPSMNNSDVLNVANCLAEVLGESQLNI